MAVTQDQRERWARIVGRYRAGEPIAEIAAREQVDRKTVYNVTRRFGLPRRHVFDQARTNRIVVAYAEGRPVKEIATREEVCRSYVRTVAKRVGLPPREDYQLAADS